MNKPSDKIVLKLARLDDRTVQSRAEVQPAAALAEKAVPRRKHLGPSAKS